MARYKEVILYSRDFCFDCQKMKKFLDKHQIQYELRDIKKNPAYREELEKKTGKLGVPYFILDGKWEIGYEKGIGFTEAYAKKLFNFIRSPNGE